MFNDELNYLYKCALYTVNIALNFHDKANNTPTEFKKEFSGTVKTTVTTENNISKVLYYICLPDFNVDDYVFVHECKNYIPILGVSDIGNNKYHITLSRSIEAMNGEEFLFTKDNVTYPAVLEKALVGKNTYEISTQESIDTTFLVINNVTGERGAKRLVNIDGENDPCVLLDYCIDVEVFIEYSWYSFVKKCSSSETIFNIIETFSPAPPKIACCVVYDATQLQINKSSTMIIGGGSDNSSDPQDMYYNSYNIIFMIRKADDNSNNFNNESEAIEMASNLLTIFYNIIKTKADNANDNFIPFEMTSFQPATTMQDKDKIGKAFYLFSMSVGRNNRDVFTGNKLCLAKQGDKFDIETNNGGIFHFHNRKHDLADFIKKEN